MTPPLLPFDTRSHLTVTCLSCTTGDCWDAESHVSQKQSMLAHLRPSSCSKSGSLATTDLTFNKARVISEIAVASLW